jgi:exopolysaccharide biosynthesis polyprenyl glycosylphosphotransferase
MNHELKNEAPDEADKARDSGAAHQREAAPDGARPGPAGRRGRSDAELLEQLYRRYAKGGTRVARIRGTAYFYFKKYSWILVIESAYFIKRLLDVLVSAIMLIALSPLFLLIALAIKIDDPGPVFFKQTRVGKWGRLFMMYKFRSMIVAADAMKEQLLDQNESGGIIFKMKQDPRITRTGRIIRKLSLDELPQLWNVLKGDMSLVGPRPPVPKEVAEYEYADRRRLEAIPGITCIWQVSGRSEIDFKGQVRLDVQYIENQSFWGDIKILLKTVPAVLFGKGAY